MKINKLKKYFKYIFIFIYFFVSLIFFFNIYRCDIITQFSYSYSISKGLLPYIDFNMISTPFSAFLYAIPLILFGHNIIVLYLTQSLLLTFLFYFLFKLLKDKAWYFFVFMSLQYPILFPFTMFPGYNFIIFFLLVLLLYFEKTNKNDYLIGMLLGITIITKHTLGVFLCLPSLFYFKTPKKIFKRIIGAFIPILVFIIYLFATKSFNSFIDLCILGLLNFKDSNSYIMKIPLIILIIEILFIIYRIIKEKSNINNYYVLVYMITVYPLIEDHHVAYASLGVLLLIIPLIKFNIKKLWLYSVFTVFFSWIFMYVFILNNINFRFNNYHNFSLYFNVGDKYKKKFDSYLVNNPDKTILLISANQACFYKIEHELKITHFDLNYNGNNGYNGIEEMKNDLKNINDPKIIIDKYQYENKDPSSQYPKEIAKYVIDNFSKCDSFGNYEVYCKK